MVSQADDPDYPSFPCYNLTTNTCNPRETTRSLLFSLLLPAGSRPLLPAIDCRRGFRKMCPSILSDASPISLAPLSEQPLHQPVLLSAIHEKLRTLHAAARDFSAYGAPPAPSCLEPGCAASDH